MGSRSSRCVKHFSATNVPFPVPPFSSIVFHISRNDGACVVTSPNYCDPGALYLMRYRLLKHVRYQLRKYVLLLIPAGLLAWIALGLVDLLSVAK